MTLTKILTFTLLSLVVLAFALAGCFTAVAEYSDLDSNAVVTFNQQVKNGNFSDGTTGFRAVAGSLSVNSGVLSFTYGSDPTSYFSNGVTTSFTPVLNHDYYLCFSFSGSKSCSVVIDIFNQPLGGFSYTDINNFSTFDSLVNCYSTTFSTIWFSVSTGVYNSGDTVQWSNIYIIDLTLMYGAGNEPSLDQCRKIFTSEYYGYTSGLSMPLNGVNSYSQGYNAAVSQFNYIVDFSQISQYGYGLEFNGWRPAFKSNYDTPDVFSFSGYVALPLGQTVPRDTLMTGSFKAVDVDSDFTLSLGLIYNNQFVPIQDFGQLNDDPDNLTTYTFSFSLPYDTNNIVLFASASQGPSVQDYYGVLVEDFVISYRYFNPLFTSSEAYNDGFVNGVNSGKVDGYNRGYAAGIKYGSSTAKEGTFLNLLSSVIQAPITALVGQYDAASGERVGGLLNFEFLGYNMSTFLMSLFSLGLVICVIRLFI